MRFKIGKSELQRGVTIVQNVISSKAPVASLSCIKLEAKQGQVTFIGTDLKVTAILSVPVDVLEDGSVSLHGPSLSDVVHELPDVDVEIVSSETDDVTIECNDILFKLHTSPVEDFPEIPGPETDVEFSMMSEQMVDVLSKVEFSISRDQSRYILTGALLSVEDDTLRAVSTDGRRMSVGTSQIEPPAGVSYSAVIPHKTVQELVRVLEHGKKLMVKAGKNRITFIVDGLRIISTVIEGRYPDYNQVVPKGYDKEIVFDTALLATVFRRVAAVATRNYKCVKLDICEGRAVLRSATPEVGQAREEIPVEFSGVDTETAFNPDYVLDVLKVVTTEKVILRLCEGESAGLFQGLDDDSGLFVVMPIQL